MYPEKFQEFIEEQESGWGLEVFLSQSQDSLIAIAKGKGYIILAQYYEGDDTIDQMFISDLAFNRLYKVMTEIKEEKNDSH